MEEVRVMAREVNGKKSLVVPKIVISETSKKCFCRQVVGRAIRVSMGAGHEVVHKEAKNGS